MNKEEAIKNIKKYVKRGDTLYCVLRHTSRSGMRRHISVYAMRQNIPYLMDAYVATIIGRRRVPMGKGEGIICDEAGMDMGFDLIHALAIALYCDGAFALSHQWL